LTRTVQKLEIQKAHVTNSLVKRNDDFTNLEEEMKVINLELSVCKAEKH